MESGWLHGVVGERRAEILINCASGETQEGGVREGGKKNPGSK